MDQKAFRAAVAKTFKARKVPLRKGSWRVPHDELTWYVQLRATGPQRDAALVFEVGCWVHGLVPEPEGGPVDCPLLLDVPLPADAEPVAETERLLDRLEAVADVDALAAGWRDGEWSTAYVDAVLRERLS